MERNISMEEISDGRLYDAGDMVKADCGGCKGCSKCCSRMGNSVVLNPFDVFRLRKSLGVSFEELLSGPLELHIVDGIILPNLSMSGQEEKCPYLNGEGRCSIHDFRPDFCRLFPLGRLYENRSFRYFLQTQECPKEGKSKVKVKKWIGMENMGSYERFIRDWHYFLKDLDQAIRQKKIQERELREKAAGEKNLQEKEGMDLRKALTLYVLKEFYMRPYCWEEDFYSQFYDRLSRSRSFAEETLGGSQ